MNKFIIPLLIAFTHLAYSQTPITFSDEFNLVDFPQYDNWSYQQESFFVLPLSLNEFLSIQTLDFNVSYDPQIIEPMVDLFMVVNSPNFTTPLNVPNALLGLVGSITAQNISVSSDLAMLTTSFSNNSSTITQEQYDSNGEVLIYLPFRKLNACNKAPFFVNFWDGNNGDSYVNPDQTNSIIVNNSLSEESGNIYTQDAVINFNILSTSVEQIGNAFYPTITGGTPPYSFEWTDKMDVVLSTDSIYFPPSSTDYLLYVSDASQCQSISFLTFDGTALVDDLRMTGIYPNPVKDVVTIDAHEPLDYQLCDIFGKPLKMGQIGPLLNTIERGNLPSGTYFLILQTERSKTTYQLTFL